MCGIVGIYDIHHKINPILLDEARNTLIHRGPNGAGSWISADQHIGLAHTRLSIVDAQGGTQPLFNQNKSIYAVVNGEFYEYQKLRTELENKGCQFITDSDSELVIHLYETYQLEFIQYLRGEFAFILFDQKTNTMIVARDRFGIKPVCYYFNDGIFYAASEAKALFNLGVKPSWNEDALYHAFCFQYLPPNATLFKDIQQLPAGHMLIYNGKTLKNQTYWNLNYPLAVDDGKLSLAAFSSELDLKLRESLSLRLNIGDTPICCHLSGGVDSATIAALGSELYGKPLPCFTVAFPHEAYNELPYAQNLAKKINAPLHPVFIDADDMADALSDAVFYSEGLAINNHLSAKYILNREIKKSGFKIVLSGEGSDELFAGYAHLIADVAPQSFVEHIASGIHLSEENSLSLTTLQQQLGFIPNFIKAKASIGYKLHALLDDTSYHPNRVLENLLSANELSQHLHQRHPVHQATYLWIKFALSGYILKTLGDGCEMAHGIEGRVPFLDHYLFDFTKQIPISMKIRKDMDKFILRKTVKKYLTPEIINKKKQPFLAPPFSLLTNKKGYDFMRDTLQFCDNLPFVNQQKVNFYLDSMLQKTIHEQRAAEPGMMLLLTAILLGQRYAL